MPSKTRGSIEEGIAVFPRHSSEVDVTFEAASAQNKGFSSAPVVKLVGTSRYPPTLVSNQGNLLYDADGSFVPTYPSNGTQSNEPADTATSNANVESDYSSTLNSTDNIVLKARRLPVANGFLTVPFDNSKTPDNGLIQVFFQARFPNWDSGANEEISIYFINKATVEANSPASPTAHGYCIGVKYTAYMNSDANSWIPITNHSGHNDYVARLEATEIDDVVPTYSSGNKAHWFRIDINTATSNTTAANQDIKDLAGIGFLNSADNAGETMDISDVSVFIWDRTAEWASSHNYLNNPVSTVTQSNIGVSFTNVTSNGMRIETSAPFTGWVRYLCSVQG